MLIARRAAADGRRSAVGGRRAVGSRRPADACLLGLLGLLVLLGLPGDDFCHLLPRRADVRPVVPDAHQAVI